MGFGCKGWLRGALIVLLWGSAAWADGEERVQVTVLVNNSAHVSESILGQAEVEAGRIFRGAGVEIRWLNCDSAEKVCQTVPAPDQFVLHIVATGRTSKDSVFGEAFLGPDGRGKYCDVFFHRIEEEPRTSGANTSQLLGAVAAHELGHLLLGSNAHSLIGIMMPDWRDQTLAKIAMGTLYFTSKQSAVMRTRIGREELQLTRLGMAAGK